MPDTTETAMPVHVYLALDRTGSMNEIRDDVIGGLNQFLEGQKAKPGKCRLTVAQFDMHEGRVCFDVVHDAVKIADVPPFTPATYVPRGSTPLLDAEGRLIVMAEERAARRAADGKRPEAILFATYTDGRENASEEWTFDALTARKKAHENDWTFIYLGVGHDGYAQSRRIGTMSVNTVSAAKDSAGVTAAFASAGAEVDNVRERAARGQRTGSRDTRAAQESGAGS